MKLLYPGDRHADVLILKSILQSQGLSICNNTAFYDDETKKAVIYFQQTHIGKDKKFLKPDAIVGPKTWWALENPTGSSQKNNLGELTKSIPQKGLNEQRTKILLAAIAEYKKPVKEIPDGSNWSKDIALYLNGVGPCPWCCYFYSWILQQSLGHYPLGRVTGLCADAWKLSKPLGLARTKEYSPVPGDAFVMLYKSGNGKFTGKGHIGFVVAVSPNGEQFNTIEGNAGNRVKLGIRKKSQDTLVGFILPDKEENQRFDHFVLSAEDVSGATTR